MSSMTAIELLNKIAEILRQNGVEFYKFEAREIVRQKTDSLYKDISDAEKEECMQLAYRRIKGEPLQYILGEWEFYSLPFFVGPGVLIPRADTETVVDTALFKIEQNGYKSVLDLCSGSGAIAISIEKNSKTKVVAVEKSEQAFLYLQKNIKRNNSSVKALKCDALTLTDGKYDLIVSNPPYIKTDQINKLQKEVLFEPEMALDGGDDGLDFYRKITENATLLLNSGGTLLFEIGFDQKEQVCEILKANGFSDIGSKTDLGGNHRAVFGTLKRI